MLLTFKGQILWKLDHTIVILPWCILFPNPNYENRSNSFVRKIYFLSEKSSHCSFTGTSRKRALLPTADHPCKGLSYIWSVYTSWYACAKLASPLLTDWREREGKAWESRWDESDIHHMIILKKIYHNSFVKFSRPIQVNTRGDNCLQNRQY